MSEDRFVEQRRVFDFLLEKYKTQGTFTKDELQNVAGWPPSTFRTYWPKQFKTLLVEVSRNTFRVSHIFVRVNTWPKFKAHVTQTRKVMTEYKPELVKNVMQFEFFMPLANEGYLRQSLDALFYKETIISRLILTKIEELEEYFKKNSTESDTVYHERICDWISDVFGGYSISHVNGRFKAGGIKSIEEASKSDRYLVDETTAVVRFIFPCTETDAEAQAERIRYFFFLLFVQNVVEVISGEDEIWLIESGMKSALHIWRAQYD